MNWRDLFVEVLCFLFLGAGIAFMFVGLHEGNAIATTFSGVFLMLSVKFLRGDR